MTRLNDLVKNLTRLGSTDAVRRKDNSYALNTEGGIIALSMSKSKIESLILDKQAVALEHLYLSDNASLKQIDMQITLSHVKYLYLDECALEELTIPGGCDKLEQIYVQKNQLKKLVFEGDCSNLFFLDASNNTISELRLPEGFARLNYLYLQQNKLKRVPQSIIKALLNNKSSLTTFCLAGSAPKNIPKVFLGSGNDNCIKDAQLWFEELHNCPKSINKTVKLMLLGNGNAGKSTLLCALKNGYCPHDSKYHTSTHGIQMASLTTPSVIYNIWDFGGQEVYHGTHRLFMASEALQVILFDPHTEKDARTGLKVKDRLNDDQIFNHPIEYWHETTQSLSPDSVFFMVQNKKDKFPEIDSRIQAYANNRAEFIHISAQTGERVKLLKGFFEEYVNALPDYDMEMPESWMRVRQFFSDNLEKDQADSVKLITEKAFIKQCEKAKVLDKSIPMLLKYLHHGGFLYAHSHLKDTAGNNLLIADQRWAINAIYKPYERDAPHYKEFRDGWKGLIKVDRLFEIFGEGYTNEEKWLFLSFMQSCGLCFHLNNNAYHHHKSENDVYVFPEFLPRYKPQIVTDYWNIAKDVKVLCYQMPWINYFVIQSFITALGRKTDTANIWRNGIHVSTKEGCFKVELDYVQKSLMIFIDKSAMPHWLQPILEELKITNKDNSLTISEDKVNFKPFNLETWKEGQKGKTLERHIIDESSERKADLLEKLPNIEHSYKRQVILLLAANPTIKELSIRNEHSHITETLIDKLAEPFKEKFEPPRMRFGITLEKLIDIINEIKPNIVHFIGHGEEVNPDLKGGGGLVFHKDLQQGSQTVDAHTLGSLFKRFKKKNPNLRIVILNACYSESEAIAISSNEIFATGTNDKIGSLAARYFSAGFYKMLAQTDDVEKSVENGIDQATAYNDDAENLIHLFYNGHSIKM